MIITNELISTIVAVVASLLVANYFVTRPPNLFRADIEGKSNKEIVLALLYMTVDSKIKRTSVLILSAVAGAIVVALLITNFRASGTLTLNNSGYDYTFSLLSLSLLCLANLIYLVLATFSYQKILSFLEAIDEKEKGCVRAVVDEQIAKNKPFNP